MMFLNCVTIFELYGFMDFAGLKLNGVMALNMVAARHCWSKSAH